jgi:hypothetical protein
MLARFGWLAIVVTGCAVDTEEELLNQSEQLLAEATSQATDTGLGTFENGYAIGTATWEKPWRVWSDEVSNGYSIAFSQRFGANLSTSSWTTNASQVSYVDGDATNCVHPTTQVGNPLNPSCSPVAQYICNADPYCCTTSWDAQCAGEATTLGDDYTGAHPTTVTGAALPDSHSQCAAAVNFVDAHCRTSAWDATCVNEAYDICYARYVTRPRIENGRFVEGRYDLGDGDPMYETTTGELSWVDDKQRPIAVVDVPAIAFSEGMRMASLIYAKRKVEKEASND